MRLLSAIFLRRNPDAAVDAVDEDVVAIDAKDAPIRAPKRRDDLEDWVPPIPSHVPAKEQAQALVALFQSEERYGPIPHWDLEASYAECAWVNGFIQITPLQLCRALGAVCTKVRRDVLNADGEVIRAAHYVIPEPYQASSDKPKPNSATGNVVPIGAKRSAIPNGTRLSARSAKAKVAGHKPARRKGGRYSADIQEAVACHR